MLSASPSPPTVLLQDRRWCGSVSVSLQSIDTPSAISCAAFQTSEGLNPSNIQFVLGFQDGTLAMYQLLVPSLPLNFKFTPEDQLQSVQLQPVRVGAMKKLHKAAIGVITAAAFVPGYKSRVVSIGHDGRCRLVDFEGGGQKLRT